MRRILPLIPVVIVMTVVLARVHSVVRAEAVAPVQPTPDTALLRRTPVLDGVVEDGEWDPFLQVQQGDFSATAYANWDEGNLYIAVTGGKPTDSMITLDAAHDGWFHGKDNYLVKLTNTAEGAVSLTLERYDSQARSASPGATETLDASGIACRHAVKADSSVVEIALPASVLEGLKPRPQGTVGLAVSLRPAVEGAPWTPMAPLGDTQTCSLSDKKAVAMDQIDISLVLHDSRVVCGQTLVARLTLKNKGAQPVPAESLVIGGDGRAARFLNSQRIRLEGLAPGESIKHKFESRIPLDMPTGSWALGAEARPAAADAARLGAVLASFEVVKPFIVDMDVGEGPFELGAQKDRAVRVTITNQTPRRAIGDVIVTIPEGWRLSPRFTKRQFEVRSEDQTAEVRFRLTPPAGIGPGDVTIKADVTINGEKYNLGKNLALVTAAE